MATVALTQDNFQERMNQPGILVLDWWAPWCGPCRTFGPVFDKASDRHRGVTFAKVNTEDEPELASSFEIRAIPTLMIFRDGILLYSRPGVASAEGIDDLVGKAQALDMDDVRRKLAEQNQPGAAPAADS